MHFLLRAIPDNDLLVMKRQGRLMWERYLGSAQASVDTIIAVIRDRLGIPPLPAPQTPSTSVFNDSFVVCKLTNKDIFRKKFYTEIMILYSLLEYIVL